MSFEEVFARYENGTATEAERAQVEAELTKLRLLEGRLAEEPMPPLPETEDAAREVKALDKRMRRRTRRQLLAYIGVLLALVLLFQIVVVAPLNRRVRDTRQWQTQGYMDFDLAMTAITDLNLPLGTYHGSFDGNYHTSTGLPLTLKFSNPDGQQTLETTLSFGALKNRDAGAYRDLMHSMGKDTIGWSTYDYMTSQTEGIPYTQTDALDEKMAQVPDYVTVTAAVSFDRILTLEELVQLKMRYENDKLEFLSAAVERPSHWPIYLRLSDPGADFGPDVPYDQFRVTEPTAENYQTHMESMLQCLIDHPAVARWINDYAADPRFGDKAVLDEIRENGVQTYGVWVRGTAESLRELLSDDSVSYAFIKDARLDLYGFTGE